MVRLPTISKSGLLLSGCAAWAHPDARHYDESKRDPEDTKKRDDGIAFHEAIHHYNTTGIVQQFADPKLNLLMVQGIKYLEKLKERSHWVRSEWAIAVNWLTGHAAVLNDVVGRNYPQWAYQDGYQPGTADLVAALRDPPGMLIADWKTGGNDGAEEQLMSLACAFRANMKPELRKEFGFSTACLSVTEETVWEHELQRSKAELDLHQDAMRFMWEDVIATRTGLPAPGIHCTQLYCPHLAYCPAISDGLRQVAAMDVAKHSDGQNHCVGQGQ